MENPPKLKPGDRVAIVSPSWAGPGAYPATHDLALRRIRELLELEPVEFPTTRRPGATPAERAADLMAAYADPGVRAVFASIGGSDQITVLPHLDPAPFRADPKPYFGYSDNTNLLNWLWLHGVPGYHGGSTMVHLARGAGVDREHLVSLRAALFETTDLEITPVKEFSDEELSWADPASLTSSAPSVPSPGFHWHNADRVVTAPTWGGNLEILHWNLAANRWIKPAAEYAGMILLLETSEEMPPAGEVFRMLRPCWWRPRRRATSRTGRRRRSGPGSATSSARRCCARWLPITPARWPSSVSISDTPRRSGSFRTAAG
jgi:muramoyltetrapeptide carboxypeptidase LdcA involved in peptidoglycan recycling